MRVLEKLTFKDFTYHQKISREIEFRMIKFAEETDLGEIFDDPIGVRFSDEIALQPDGVPDLIVEIISKGTKNRDMKVKKAIYERFGVKEYWIVNPFDRSIDVYALNDRGSISYIQRLNNKVRF